MPRARDLTRDLADYDRVPGWSPPTARCTVSDPASDPGTMKQIRYLAAAFRAPRVAEAAARLAAQARGAGWTHEDYLAAVLERGVSDRNASGA
jgi:hypothetical protein